ncbi:myb protein-related [Anaeramoeba flamelloides]|uniref:Myb protein-related n=1 Tax=Anaeramoeba flamelloides TaxID=1746091 RepID=A0ABQ8Y111_9EUKA|nr:myb protein-related [Anaeramoeba flamelloides]
MSKTRNFHPKIKKVLNFKHPKNNYDPQATHQIISYKGKQRSNFITVNGIRKGSWQKEEDKQLCEAIKKNGSFVWKQIALFVPSRTPKQCRERWIHQLNPELFHGDWTQGEDEKILESRKIIGNKWSIIQKQLPRRSANAIKNRYYSLAALEQKKNKRKKKIIKKINNEILFEESQLNFGTSTTKKTNSNSNPNPNSCVIDNNDFLTILNEDQMPIRKRKRKRKKIKKIVLHTKNKIQKTNTIMKISEFDFEEELKFISKKSKFEILLFVAEQYHKFENVKLNPFQSYLNTNDND